MRYSSTIDEHHAVRKHAGMFDVSHMLTVDFEGSQSSLFLRKLLASDVNKLSKDGQALYTVMLNERGGIIDDLIAYRLHETSFRIVFNAGVAAADLEWVTAWQQTTAYAVSITPRRDSRHHCGTRSKGNTNGYRTTRLSSIVGSSTLHGHSSQ